MQQQLVDPILLDMLACPESKQPVKLADAALVEKLNAAQATGALRNRGGEAVGSRLDGGLVRADGAWLYPIIDGIPVMMIPEAISLAEFH